MADDASQQFDRAAATTSATNWPQIVGVIKHRLSHVLLPIDTDLQGLRETDFQEEYWEEVAKAYAGEKAVGALSKVRNLLYERGVERETIEKIVQEATADGSPLAERKQAISDIWQQIRECLPLEHSRTDADLLEILRELQSPDGREEVRRLDGGQFFHDWFARLDTALESLWLLLKEASPAKEDRPQG
jgi:hypothetical protein